MASFRIDFALHPPAEPAASWFVLTEGEYDVIFGDQHLFRTVGGDRIGYPVARLWEDLIQAMPAVRRAIPAALSARAANLERWQAWLERAWALDGVDDLLIAASAWWEHRRISSAHIIGAPTLYLWREGDEVHARWHSGPREPHAPRWTSPQGAAVIAFAAFEQELQRFDRALMDAMSARVAADENLREQHQDRTTWLLHARTMPWSVQHGWDEVLAAVTALEARIGPVG